jgi:hypothetical protein
MLAKMETNQGKVDAKSDANHESIRMDSWLEKMEAEVDVFEEKLNNMDTTDLEACLEKTGAYLERKEPTPEEIKG